MAAPRIRPYTTSSSLGKDGECPPNATLPGTDEQSLPADVGSAKHRHIEHRGSFGIDEAMSRVGDVGKEFALSEREQIFFASWARKFEWTPPPHTISEIALALLDDGTVERTVGGKGDYPELKEGGRLFGKSSLAGQTDLLWSEPEPLDLSDPARPRCPKGSVLWVGDLKGGGDVHVPPIDRNLQLASNAIMAAKWTGARFVVPFVMFLTPPRGDWDAPETAWGPKELAEAETRVRDVLARRRAQIDRVLAGLDAEGWREGPWCTFCHGKQSCPAKVTMMRHTAGLAVARAPLELSDEEAAWWAIRLTQIESYATKAREVLKARVDERGPIPLGGGLVWGSMTLGRKRILPHVALPIIQQELGLATPRLDEVASVSRGAIEDLVRQEHAKQGIKRQKGKVVARIMAKVIDAGGLEPYEVTQYGTYRTGAAAAELGGEEDGDVSGAGEEAAAQ